MNEYKIEDAYRKSTTLVFQISWIEMQSQNRVVAWLMVEVSFISRFFVPTVPTVSTWTAQIASFRNSLHTFTFSSSFQELEFLHITVSLSLYIVPLLQTSYSYQDMDTLKLSNGKKRFLIFCDWTPTMLHCVMCSFHQMSYQLQLLMFSCLHNLRVTIVFWLWSDLGCMHYPRFSWYVLLLLPFFCTYVFHFFLVIMYTIHA